MKRGKIAIVFSLLIISAVMAAAGSGALDVFSSPRQSNVSIANDSNGYLAITGGPEKYAYEQKDGTFIVDFSDTNKNVIGKGVNFQANSSFNKVFTITNQSAKTLNVWLSTDDSFPWQPKWGLDYKVNPVSTGKVVNATAYGVPNYLIWTANSNFKNTDSSPRVDQGALAYAILAPGQNIVVDIDISTNDIWSYKAGDNFNHKIYVKADSTNAPK